MKERDGRTSSPIGDPALVAERRAGVLLHPTALTSGRLGSDASEFLEWLEAAGQTWWQVLPLGPPDESGSPYAARSAFAGSSALLATHGAPVSSAERDRFCQSQSYWLEGWARFAGADAIDDQVRFQREWGSLRDEARARGVRLLGDVPLYVAREGADTASWPDLFQVGEVAGAPPDDYSAIGQLWGNPLHDWAAHRRDGYRWWIERLRRTLELVDAARVDHFRGFVSYWAVPASAPDAGGGRWRRGPGGAPLEAAARELGELPLVAEDLGLITPAVEELRRGTGLPGMRVIQWAFRGGHANPHRLANHPRCAVAYTGTHDNMTIVEWWSEASRREREEACAAARERGIDEREPHLMLIRLVLSSSAAISIVPAQDLLGLGRDARFNTPGTSVGNWRWRLPTGALDAGVANWLRQATEQAGRAVT